MAVAATWTGMPLGRLCVRRQLPVPNPVPSGNWGTVPTAKLPRPGAGTGCGGVKHSRGPHPQHGAEPCQAVPSPARAQRAGLHPHNSTQEGPGYLHRPPLPCLCSFWVNKRLMTFPCGPFSLPSPKQAAAAWGEARLCLGREHGSSVPAGEGPRWAA